MDITQLAEQISSVKVPKAVANCLRIFHTLETHKLF